MVIDCDHIGRTYENQKEERNGTTMYLYVCHDCQTGFFSASTPKPDDYWPDDSIGLFDDMENWGF